MLDEVEVAAVRFAAAFYFFLCLRKTYSKEKNFAVRIMSEGMEWKNGNYLKK